MDGVVSGMGAGGGPEGVEDEGRGVENEVVGGGGAEAQSQYSQMASAVADCLSGGRTIPDPLYVSLLVHSIQLLPDYCNGFVLQDFPTTPTQALLLMEALSGTHYDSHRPQPSDYVSPYAPPIASEAWAWDVSRCGLDAVIHVDSGGISSALGELSSARREVGTG
ncbi:hypothetical protein B484DRAFT_402457, partial [Ochromonadaceae sp. CCMP2298]